MAADSSSAALPPSVAAAERRAREYLGQGKWRKARDEVKPLVRAFRAQFLPVLIEANVGLAREMAAKGQVAEARQVMAYLATIAPAEQIRALEIEVASRSMGEGEAVAKFAGLLADPAASLSEPGRLRLADQTVLAFEALAEDTPAKARVAAEARAVQSALAAACGAQWERVAELLRAIPHRSPFSHWAVFIKGLAAFHSGDFERAARLFISLPEKSAPGRASHAYLVLAGRLKLDSRTPFLEATLGGVCRLMGLPGFAATLLRADRLWQEGRHTQSYRLLRDTVPQFPSGGLDALGALSEFYFQAPVTMTAEQQIEYLDYFDRVIEPAPKNAVEDMLVSRMEALARARFGYTDLLSTWERFLKARGRLYAPDPHLAALAYAWAGEKLAQPRPAPRFGGQGKGPRMVNGRAARECLQKAIECDPGHLPAYLVLCRVLETLNRTAERNRLLDEMTRRFPEEKLVLIEAARHCIGRKAFTKALDLLESARKLDRLDPQIPKSMALARIRLARRYFRDRHTDKARQVLEAAQELLIDKPDDFLRSRWTGLARHGLLEQAYGDPAQGKVLLERARSASPFPAAFLFFVHLTHRVYTAEGRGDSPFVAELRAELGRNLSAAQAGLLLRLFLYWANSSEKPPLDNETKWMRKLLNGVAKRGTTREEAKQLAELCGEGGFAEQALALVRAVLRKDGQDPLFRLLEHSLRDEGPYRRPQSEKELQSILQEARRRGDQEAIQRAEQALRSLHQPPPRPVPGFDDFEDDEDFEDEEDFDDEPMTESGDLPPGAVNPGELAELISLLAGAPPEMVAEIRRSLVPEMPTFIFDMIVKAAKTGKRPAFPGPPFPAPPRAPKPPNPPRAPKPPQAPQPRNPNQDELF
jgi:tetratricopeptide (TPR) repeat protein